MLSPWSDRCFRIRRIAQLVDHFGGKQEGELCDDYWSERTIAYTMIQEFKAILVCTWSERFFVKIIECHLLTYMFHMLALFYTTRAVISMMQIFKSMFSTRQFEICTHPLAVYVDEGCNDRMLWKVITSVHVRIVNKPFIHNYTSAQ